MGKITLYEPVCSSKSEKSWFTVNGAIDPDRDRAISKAMKHAGVRDGAGKVERVDEHQVDEDEYYKPSRY